MSTKGIGYYVHYHAEHYQQFGITEDQKGYDFTSSLNEAHERLKNLYQAREMSGVNWKKYSEFLNTIIYPDIKENNYSSSVIDSENQNFIAEYTANLIDKSGLDKEIVNSLISSTNTKEQADKNISTYKGLNKNKNKKYDKKITVQSVYKLLRSLETILKRAYGNLNKKVIDITTFDKIMSQGYQYIKDLMDLLEKANIDMNIDLDNLNYKGQLRTRLDAISKKNGNQIEKTDLGIMIDSINNFITKNSLISTKLTGDIGEAFIGAATILGGQVAKKATYDAIADTLGRTKNDAKWWAGSNKEHTVLTGFSDFIDLKDLAEELTGKDNKGPWTWKVDEDTIIYTNPTDQTVDLSISLESESQLAKEMGITDFNASIKNYGYIDSTVHPGVSVISGTPLLNILMLLETDFVNHYLNLLGVHDKNKRLNNTEEAQQAKELVHFAVAVRALTGIRNKQNRGKFSDCFIVNDRSASKVYIIPTVALLNNISNRIENYTQAEGLPTVFHNAWYYPEKDKKNSIADKQYASARIITLLSELHKFKISLSLLPNAIKNNSV